VNLKEEKVETTSFLTLVLWTTIVKLPNPAVVVQFEIHRAGNGIQPVGNLLA